MMASWGLWPGLTSWKAKARPAGCGFCENFWLGSHLCFLSLFTDQLPLPLLITPLYGLLFALLYFLKSSFLLKYMYHGWCGPSSIDNDAPEQPNAHRPFLPSLHPPLLYPKCILWKWPNNLLKRSVLSQCLCLMPYQREPRTIKYGQLWTLRKVMLPMKPSIADLMLYLGRTAMILMATFTMSARASSESVWWYLIFQKSTGPISPWTLLSSNCSVS